MPAIRMPVPGIRPITARPGQSPMQSARPATRVGLPQPGGFGARTQMTAPVARPAPVAQPRFNLPTPVQAAPAPLPPASFFQPAPGPQNPVGGFQTPPPAMNPPVSDGNFGTIQSSPYPVSGVAMPTPNPVPPAPPPNLPTGGMMTPGSLGDQVAQQQTGMMTPGSIVDQVAQQQTGMMALPGMNGPQMVGGPVGAPIFGPGPLQSVGGLGGPPQMTLQDYINMGINPATAQTMMSQFGPMQ